MFVELDILNLKHRLCLVWIFLKGLSVNLHRLIIYSFYFVFLVSILCALLILFLFSFKYIFILLYLSHYNYILTLFCIYLLFHYFSLALPFFLNYRNSNKKNISRMNDFVLKNYAENRTRRTFQDGGYMC